MKDKQTAVEWLKNKLFELEIKIDSKAYEEAFFIFEQAKQIEKEQIMNAYRVGKVEIKMPNEFNTIAEDYYNETYGSQAPQRLEEANGE
jgi:hypothetical protein